MFKKRNKGFTLIELIVVMIIIGILVLLATPRFITYIKKARYTNIVNDIRVVETTIIPRLVKNKDSLYRFLSDHPGDKDQLLDQAKNKQLYMKDGFVVVDEDKNEFKPEVGNLSSWKVKENAQGLEGFYIIDKENYLKPETRTRLPGYFLVNDEGYVIYSKEEIGELEETDDSLTENSDLFTYSSEDPKNTDYIWIRRNENGDVEETQKEHIYLDGVSIITGFDESNDRVKDFLSRNEFPPIPKYRILENGDKVRIEGIKNNAFSSTEDYQFTGDFNGPYIKYIGFKAFGDRDDRARPIGHKFTGNFNGPRVERIGSYSFAGARFNFDDKANGRLNVPEVTSIGEDAFTYSMFDSANLSKLEKIGQYALMSSPIKSKLEASNLRIVEYAALPNARFTGQPNFKKLEHVGGISFYNSQFTGDFIAEELKEISPSSFYNSRFNGDFIAPNLTRIHKAAFLNSEFTKENKSRFKAPKIEFLGGIRHTTYEAKMNDEGYIEYKILNYEGRDEPTFNLGGGFIDYDPNIPSLIEFIENFSGGDTWEI